MCTGIFSVWHFFFFYYSVFTNREEYEKFLLSVFKKKIIAWCLFWKGPLSPSCFGNIILHSWTVHRWCFQDGGRIITIYFIHPSGQLKLIMLKAVFTVGFSCRLWCSHNSELPLPHTFLLSSIVPQTCKWLTKLLGWLAEGLAHDLPAAASQSHGLHPHHLHPLELRHPCTICCCWGQHGHPFLQVCGYGSEWRLFGSSAACPQSPWFENRFLSLHSLSDGMCMLMKLTYKTKQKKPLECWVSKVHFICGMKPSCFNAVIFVLSVLFQHTYEESWWLFHPPTSWQWWSAERHCLQGHSQHSECLHTLRWLLLFFPQFQPRVTNIVDW